MADKQKGPWAGRILIMVFGFCIVAIGAQPIQKKYGSFLNFLKSQSRAQAKEASGHKAGEASKNSRVLKSFTLPNLGKKAAPNEAKVETTNKSKNLDKLEANDRKQLDNLLNSN